MVVSLILRNMIIQDTGQSLQDKTLEVARQSLQYKTLKVARQSLQDKTLGKAYRTRHWAKLTGQDTGGC